MAEMTDYTIKLDLQCARCDRETKFIQYRNAQPPKVVLCEFCVKDLLGENLFEIKNLKNKLEASYARVAQLENVLEEVTHENALFHANSNVPVPKEKLEEQVDIIWDKHEVGDCGTYMGYYLFIWKDLVDTYRWSCATSNKADGRWLANGSSAKDTMEEAKACAKAIAQVLGPNEMKGKQNDQG